MRRLALGLLCLALLPGCAALQRINPFARLVPSVSLPYDARLVADRGTAEFAVRVRTQGAPIAAWRESARFEGTRHCLAAFGSSRIDWLDTGVPGAWRVASGTDGIASVRGRCTPR